MSLTLPPLLVNPRFELSQLTLGALLMCAGAAAWAAPSVTRLSPPSELFSQGQANNNTNNTNNTTNANFNPNAPLVARFLPGQKFDLQATLVPDSAQGQIADARFLLDGQPLKAPTSLRSCEEGCLATVPKNATIATLRALQVEKPGVHHFSVTAQQNDGQTVTAQGQFEVVAWQAVEPGKSGQSESAKAKVKNVIILLGDGMGAAHRTAARIVSGAYAQGKANQPLEMDLLPITGMVKTSSLNALVTDSSPGMSSYVTGNKHNNNEEGVFPDDTIDPFDNPRMEYLSEYLHRTQGKSLGLVTTADVFDATPAANAVHTSNRGAGTGIVDQYLDDRGLTGLSVLMGGGRKWFLPASVPGSARAVSNDYAFATDANPALAHTAHLVKAWGIAPGQRDPERDLIADFERAGFAYAPDKTTLDAVSVDKTDRLLGLFSYSNMNVALDKINGRRAKTTGSSGTSGAASTASTAAGGGQSGASIVEAFGFPDQPMLDEMTTKALAVLEKNKKGFVLMVEGASIDKQAHNMDTERWILETLEFDKAVGVARAYALKHPDTLVIVTADHETAGASLIGASKVTDQKLQELIQAGGTENVRDKVVGVYEQAKFPRYSFSADGYPQTEDTDFRLLVGYGANADRYEDWRTNPQPITDPQQPFANQAPQSTYPSNPLKRDVAGRYLVTGQVPGNSAVHTATDVPLSAMGRGAWAFTGVMDNTDVFFKIGQAVSKGVPVFKDR